MSLAYAPRGLIGVLTPQANTTVEPEFWIMLPPGVAAINARMVSPKEALEARLVDYLANLDAAIAQERVTPFTGRPWERLLEPVSAEETRRAAEELLHWAEARDDETGRTHAIRARDYLEHGQWITKKEAGA